MKPVRAYLVLEDGSIYEGEARGAFREMACEVVFNTSMTGYLEILTDPSYAGQGVVMTYPMIGNYGVSREDFESIRLQPCAFFLHELCDTPSNFRSTASLESVLNEFDIPCIVGLDTRAIVKKLRESGTMRGMMTDDISNMKHCMEVIGAFRQVGLVESVSITKPEIVGEGNTGPKIALMDFGVKRNIARSLASRGCEVTIYPCFATAEEIIAAKPDGLMLSNGPGDPKDCKGIIREIALRLRDAHLRHLPRASAHGALPGRRYRAHEIRPPRREPSSEVSGGGPLLHLLAEPRLYGQGRGPATQRGGQLRQRKRRHS